MELYEVLEKIASQKSGPALGVQFSNDVLFRVNEKLAGMMKNIATGVEEAVSKLPGSAKSMFGDMLPTTKLMPQTKALAQANPGLWQSMSRLGHNIDPVAMRAGKAVAPATSVAIPNILKIPVAELGKELQKFTPQQQQLIIAARNHLKLGIPNQSAYQQLKAKLQAEGLAPLFGSALK